MKTFDNKLKEIDLAESRIDDIVEAANKMHSAICKLDKYNLNLLNHYFPQFIDVAKTFGEYDQFSNSDFDIDASKPISTTEVVKRLAVQGEIDADELFGGDV